MPRAADIRGGRRRPIPGIGRRLRNSWGFRRVCRAADSSPVPDSSRIKGMFSALFGLRRAGIWGAERAAAIWGFFTFFNRTKQQSRLIRRAALRNNADWACASPERRTDRPELATVRINGELRY